MVSIAAQLPGVDLGDEYGAVWQAPIKTLAIQDADFDFSHVEPAGVFRGVVKTTRRSSASAFLTPSTSSKHLWKWVLRLSMTRWMRRAVA